MANCPYWVLPKNKKIRKDLPIGGRRVLCKIQMSGGGPPNNKISVRVKGLGLAKHCKHAMKGCCVKIPSSYALKMYVEMCLRSITIWHVYWSIGTQHHLLQKRTSRGRFSRALSLMGQSGGNGLHLFLKVGPDESKHMPYEGII